MNVKEINLKSMLEFRPDEGKLLLGRDRMLLFRQDAFAALRKLMHEQVGATLTRALLSQFGYRCGAGDQKELAAVYSWDTESDQISAGPVMHMWEGIVHVEPTGLTFDRKTGDFHMTGIWRNSYEAEVHLKELGPSTEPVCHSLTGYASGWVSSFFGSPLLAIETHCVGRGDEHCAFEIRPPAKWGPEADPWKQTLTATNYSIARELEEKVALVDRQHKAIMQLSSPIIQVWDGVLTLPVVGVVDSARTAQIMEDLLGAIVRSGARYAILDLTGVDSVDTNTADNFLRIARAVQMLGAKSIITGIRPAVAQTMVSLGADLQNVTTLATLQDGLKACMRSMGVTFAGASGAR